MSPVELGGGSSGGGGGGSAMMMMADGGGAADKMKKDVHSGPADKLRATKWKDDMDEATSALFVSTFLQDKSSPKGVS